MSALKQWNSLISGFLKGWCAFYGHAQNTSLRKMEGGVCIQGLSMNASWVKFLAQQRMITPLLFTNALIWWMPLFDSLQTHSVLSLPQIHTIPWLIYISHLKPNFLDSNPITPVWSRNSLPQLLSHIYRVKIKVGIVTYNDDRLDTHMIARQIRTKNRCLDCVIHAIGFQIPSRQEDHNRKAENVLNEKHADEQKKVREVYIEWRRDWERLIRVLWTNTLLSFWSESVACPMWSWILFDIPASSQ